MTYLSRAWNVLGTSITVIGAAAVAVMTVHTVVDVTRRTLFNSPDAGTLEFVTYYYMTATVLLGVHVAQRRREHIAVTMLTDRLTGAARTMVLVLGGGITALVAGAMCVLGWEVAMTNMQFGEYSGASRIPVWPARFLVPLGFGAFAVQVVIDLVALRRQPELDVQGSEKGSLVA